MDVRTTQMTVLQRALADSGRLTSQLARLQMQASSGKRLTRVSDDPAAALGMMLGGSQVQRLGAHLEAIQGARTWLNTSTSALQQISTLFTTARMVAVEASTSFNNPAALEAYAAQIDGMLNRLLDLTNQQQDGRYLFSGSAATTRPFVVTQSDPQGRPLAVQYAGADGPTSALVQPNREMAILSSGRDLFLSRARQAPIYSGRTGARAGAGTDTAIGSATLLLQHTGTSFAPGSGVQSGLGAASDTVLGPAGAHRLQIVDTSGTGTAGTIALDGGTPVAFTSSDTNLRLTNAQGDVVFVDTTAIVPGFNGAVDLTATGTLSMDGGATTVSLTFSSDQLVTDPATGQSMHVDTTGVVRAGSESVSHPGTYDAFQMLMALRDELRNVHQRTNTEQIKAISALIGEIDHVHDNMLKSLGEQSISLQALDSVQSHFEDLQTAAKGLVSELGDTDISEVVVKLQTYQQMLQLSLATFARVNDQSLLNFLR